MLHLISYIVFDTFLSRKYVNCEDSLRVFLIHRLSSGEFQLELKTREFSVLLIILN